MFIRLRRYFLSGLAILLPLVATLYVLYVLLKFADGLLGKYIQPVLYEHLGFYVPGIGVVLLVIFITILGMIVSNFVGRVIHNFVEKIVLQLPIIKQVYPAFKEIAQFLFARPKNTFQQVVLVEYPRKGIHSIGFLTNEGLPRIETAAKQNELCSVFIPSAPGPLTGFLIIVPKKDLVFPDMTVEQAIKMIVSGGVVKSDG